MKDQSQELVEAMDYVDKKIAVAEALQRLMNNPDWQLVIDEVFVKNWALTQINNLAVYNQEQRRGYLEQAMARGVFNQFIYETVEDGKIAKTQKSELQQEMEG
jgi:hypothetical protein